MNEEDVKFYYDIIILILLYILQGFPLGLAETFPQIIQTRGATYRDLALFSITTWAFCLKIFWAPIVDGIYASTIGRRKTWIVSTQILIGLFLIFLSTKIDFYLDNITHRQILIKLVALFTTLTFLAATQDIAVDGWGITLMPRQYISYASFCNTVGQTIGYIIGNTIFILFTSRQSFLSNLGLSVLESQFVYYVGFLYIFVTISVLLFKKEESLCVKDGGGRNAIFESYKKLYDFITSCRIFYLSIVMFALKFCYSTSDSLLYPKLVEFGLRSEDMATLSIPFMLISMTFSIIINRIIKDKDPVSTYLNMFPIKMGFVLLSMGFMHIIQYYKDSRGLFIFLIVIYSAFQEFITYTIYCSWSRLISLLIEPKYSGSQYTFFNTVSNLSYQLPKMISLSLVDSVTLKNCVTSFTNSDEKSCVVTLDGYHTISLLFVGIGFIIYKYNRRKFECFARESLHLINDSICCKND